MSVVSKKLDLGGSEKVMLSEIKEMVKEGRGVILFKLHLVVVVLLKHMLQ